MPILNHLLRRMRLQEFLDDALPKQDARTKVSPAKTLLVLLRNLLASREPIYGVGEWAARHAPDLLGLGDAEVALLNDDRVGRALDRLFEADVPSLVLAVATHVVKEFDVKLDELHNDSTTVTFCGSYLDAAVERKVLGQPTLAITFGHNKDHRPDLKQLLYILTVTADGSVPLHFRAASGNVSDDRTHCDTWDLLCQLTGRRDFLYVADSKLATRENMAYVHQNQGRFVTLLPRTRKEHAQFRERLADGQVEWRSLWKVINDAGEPTDCYSTSTQAANSEEGYRLVWYHSLRKVERDAIARSERISRTLKQLAELRDKLRTPRTRYRQQEKVSKAVARILDSHGAATWIATEITSREEEIYRQTTPGRPGKDTQYSRSVNTRFELSFRIDVAKVAESAASDGVFPLITNVSDLSELELLKTYKRQSPIEKRFSQLKSDFEVAPVYLKSVHRIQALLSLYFFAMLLQSLLERELRQAMQTANLKSLPLYPEGRICHRPTSRRVLDLFDPIQRHTLTHTQSPSAVMVTDLSPVQRQLLRLLGMPAKNYGH